MMMVKPLDLKRLQETPPVQDGPLGGPEPEPDMLQIFVLPEM